MSFDGLPVVRPNLHVDANDTTATQQPTQARVEDERPPMGDSGLDHDVRPDAADDLLDAQQIFGQLHDGSVLLLHAVSNTNVAILPDLIDGIRAKGYEFTLISEIG